MTLPPHEWDDPPHRTQIHLAFTKWFVAYEAGNRVHAHRLRMELVRLIEDAKLRALARAVAV